MQRPESLQQWGTCCHQVWSMEEEQVRRHRTENRERRGRKEGSKRKHLGKGHDGNMW